jgi:polar amino acid transport system substrate-binding protein
MTRRFSRRDALKMAAAAGGSVLLQRHALAAAGPTITSADGTFDRIKAANSIRFGTSNDQPYAFLDSASGEIMGVDAEILLAILDKLGIANHTIQQVDFDGLIPSLLASRMDLIADGMYITDKRKKAIDFSDGWYKYGEAFVVKKGNPRGLHTLDSLKGVSVGGQLGTVDLDWLNAIPGADVKSYPTTEVLFQDLMTDRLEVGLIDAPVAGYEITRNPAYQAKFEIVSDYVPREMGTIGAGFRKDEGSLREAINWALAAVKADGTDLKILKKWGLSEQNRAS